MMDSNRLHLRANDSNLYSPQVLVDYFKSSFPSFGSSKYVGIRMYVIVRQCNTNKSKYYLKYNQPSVFACQVDGNNRENNNQICPSTSLSKSMNQDVSHSKAFNGRSKLSKAWKAVADFHTTMQHYYKSQASYSKKPNCCPLMFLAEVGPNHMYQRRALDHGFW